MWRFMGTQVEDVAGLERWISARMFAVQQGTALAFVHRDATSGAAFGSTSLFDIDLANRRMEIGHTWLGASHRRTAANTEGVLRRLLVYADGTSHDRVVFSVIREEWPDVRARLGGMLSQAKSSGER